jgi:hypothetical protein
MSYHIVACELIISSLTLSDNHFVTIWEISGSGQDVEWLLRNVAINVIVNSTLYLPLCVARVFLNVSLYLLPSLSPSQGNFQNR